MMLYKNNKAMVRSSNGDTEIFDTTLADVLQGDALVPFLFVIALDITTNIIGQKQGTWFHTQQAKN